MNSDSEYSSSGDDEITNFDVEVEDGNENQVIGAAAAAAASVQPFVCVPIGLLDFDEDDNEPYGGEPLADQEWLENYDRRIARVQEQEHFLNSRLNGTVTVNSW